ncbi:MAG: glycosyltransferase [Bryobacteraceae bacterium]
MRWALITGEYPPQFGGVSDHTASLAQRLADAGDEVHVWAVGSRKPAADVVGRAAVTVHCTGQSGLDRGLDATVPERILVQYVPHAFGWKAMNVPFCRLIARRREHLSILFHEVAFPREASQPLRHRLLAAVNRVMARTLIDAADRVYISTPAWQPRLDRIAGRHVPAVWLPTPSNLPTAVRAGDAAALRKRLDATGEARLIGHFGTFGSLLMPLLESIFVSLLASDPRVKIILTGRGSAEFAAGRSGFHASGGVPAGEAALYLAACDLIVQPYPDGVTSRRGSIMASLALGLPVITNRGPATEPVWEESEAVALAHTAEEFGARACTLLADATARAALARRGASLYQDRFAIEHTIRALRQGHLS